MVETLTTAGDFIKSAHDLALPVIGVGLRWARGYARQKIGDDGLPFSEFPTYPASFLDDTGVRVRARVARWGGTLGRSMIATR